MNDQQFSDEFAQALKDLNHFIVESASSDCVSLGDFQEFLNTTIVSASESADTLSAILDRALSETEGDGISSEEISEIMDSLQDDLNDAQPILRVIHNPSDQWSVVEQLTGDGLVEAIAYFASPNIAESALDFLAGQVTNT